MPVTPAGAFSSERLIGPSTPPSRLTLTATVLFAPWVTRLAPFYDIASYLPYVDRRLHEVRLAMRIGKEYLVRRIALADWKRLAESIRLDAESVLKRIETLLPRIPDAMRAVARRAVDEGLATELVDPLAERIIERSRECEERLAGGKTGA